MIYYSLADASDAESVERLAALHQDELGFVAWGALGKAIREGGVILAEDEGERFAVGFLSFYMLQRKPVAMIQYLAVEEAWRRKGIGRYLVSVLTDLCRTSKRSGIRLRCKAGLPANEFYQALGFQLESCLHNGKTHKNLWFLPLSS